MPLLQNPMAESVRPLKGAPPVQRDWARFGLPETGWILLTDRVQCAQCSRELEKPCISACGEEHHLLPEARYAMNACAQCDPAPCVEVCPTEAIAQSEQGVVEVDQELCIGCRFCEDACATGALLFVDPYQVAPPPFGVPHYTSGRPTGELPGTVAKCTFCSYRLTAGQLPVCVDNCHLGAKWVGNLDRNTATNGQKVVRLTDLLEPRRLKMAAPGKRMVYLVG